MIRDKTSEKLALLYGDARFHYGRYTLRTDLCTQTKQEVIASIRACYKFIPREEMQRRFPEIDKSLDSMFQNVKI